MSFVEWLCGEVRWLCPYRKLCFFLSRTVCYLVVSRGKDSRGRKYNLVLRSRILGYVGKERQKAVGAKSQRNTMIQYCLVLMIASSVVLKCHPRSDCSAKSFVTVLCA